MSKELVVQDIPTMELGDILAKSGYFQDASEAAQAIVKVLAGRELGIGPVASMTGIHIIKGKPSLGANLIGAAIKRSGRYNYRINEITNERCALTFYEDGEEVGPSVFTKADAQAAGTQNMNKFPRNMLFARAISNGARWYCPDIFGGGPVYTPEELGAKVDGEGDVIIDATVIEPETTTPTTAAAHTPITAADVSESRAVMFPAKGGAVALGDLNKEQYAKVCKWIDSNGNATKRPDIDAAVKTLERNTARINSRKKAFERVGLNDGAFVAEHFENRYAAIAALSHSFVIVIDDQQHAPLWAKVYRAQRVAGGTVYEAATGADTTVLAQGEGDE